MSLQDDLKIELLKQAIQKLTGEMPLVQKIGDKTKFIFTPRQQIQLRTWLKAQIEKKPTPSNIEIDALPILLPIAIEKAAPWVLGIAAIGFLFGRISNR